MKSIKKVSEGSTHQYTTNFEVDCGMFQVDAQVYSTDYEVEGLTDKLFSCEFTDIAFEFRIDGKLCQYSGFEELYEKLFGEGSYITFTKELADYVETEHLKLSGRPYLQNVSVDKATEYLSELLTTSNYATGTTMLDNKEIVYTDKYNIIELAKIAAPNKVHRLKCKHTNSSSDREYIRTIFEVENTRI